MMSRIKEISASELVRLLDSENHFEIVDIRTGAEIERGVIPNSRTLPMHLVPLNLNFFTVADKQVIIYCRTGSRSAQVCRFLNQQGIHNVISLRGGIVKWSSSGLSLAEKTGNAIA